MIKESILQDIMIPNVYASKNTVSKYVRQKLTELQGEIDESTIIGGDLSIPVSEVFRSSRQKTNKDIIEFNTVSHLNVCILPHPATARYMFFSSSHGILTKIDHILGRKAHPNKLRRMEIIQCLFSDHSGIELQINNRKTAGKLPDIS